MIENKVTTLSTAKGRCSLFQFWNTKWRYLLRDDLWFEMLIKNILLSKGHIICKSFFDVRPSQNQYLIRNIIRSYGNDPTMSKRALVFLAPGYEELEAIASIDILRRAGVSIITYWREFEIFYIFLLQVCVCIAGLPDKNPVKSARDVEVTPGIGVCDVANSGPFDVMVLPGGLGCAKALSECKEVGKLLKDQEANGRKIAAICACEFLRI